MRQKIINYIRSGHPGLYIVSPEEARVEAVMRQVTAELDYSLHTWSLTQGMLDIGSGDVRAIEDPVDALNAICELPDSSAVVFKDLYQVIDDNPVIIRTIKDVLAEAKTKGKCLIMIGCRQTLSPELEREFVVLDFALPAKEQLGHVLDGICESVGLDKPACDQRDAVLDAASGLTTTEAENAFALSVVEIGNVDPRTVAYEKAQTVKKNGLLEIVDAQESLDDVGGLDVLKDWLLKRREAFTRRAIEYGLPTPKGLLILGIPGTGKSLTAKVTASVFGRPLLKLDAGRIFGSLVGQSEANLRAVIQTAEAVAPCVLWIDEIEKGLGGGKSSASTDGGTSSRVFGSFISWMQEKVSPVFVVATANDVTQLPPEMLRKGRWDEIMFVDLPNQDEREAIWRIQIVKHGRDPEKYDIPALAKGTDGYTGAEIEQAFIDSLYAAFSEGNEPSDQSIVMAASETVPLSKLMPEQINGLRKWAKGRARLATSAASEPKGRRIAA